jgi:hypothetical protein
MWWFFPCLILPRVARWYIFKPKIPIWENFGRSWNGRCYGHLGYFTHGHLVYSVAIWYILLSFSIFSPFWYMYQEKSGNPNSSDILQNLALFWTKNAQFFGENIFKIITSAPGQPSKLFVTSKWRDLRSKFRNKTN